MSCVVEGCKNIWYPNCGVKFHGFPSNPDQKNAWLSKIPLKTKFYNSAKICSLHFRSEDYNPERPDRLLNSAIPKFSGCCKTLECDNVPSSSQETLCSEAITAPILEKYLVENEPPKKKNMFEKIEAVDFLVCTPTITCSQGPKTECHNVPSSSQKTLCSKAIAAPVLKKYLLENEPPKKKKKIIKIEAVDFPVSLNTPTVTCYQGPKTNLKNQLVLEVFNNQVKVKTPHNKSLEKRTKILQQKVNRQSKKIKNLKELIKVVRKYTSQSEIENILQGNFPSICQAFKTKSKKNITYSNEIKSFALTLHFYSPKAYNFLRSVISLPHETTLWRSISSFDCSVGFLSEVIAYLKRELSNKSFLKNVALIFDSMSLKQDVSYCDKLKKTFGYVDLGDIPVSDPEQVASEALVFQIVSYSNCFKCPIGYFFTSNSLNAELLGQLIYTAIILLSEAGITVRSLTCDGAKCNVKAYECLGCRFDENNLHSYFPHPNGVTNVYCLFDPAHMLKLARNVFAEKGLQSPNGEISFKYVHELHQLQQEEGLKLSNKLIGPHVAYQNKKMNVRLAFQVLSSSVADAIDFLRNSGNPKFQDSSATTEFIRIMVRLFDSMNSRSPYGTYSKSPLTIHSRDWLDFFNEADLYFKNLKIRGQPLMIHIRKTFCIGFLVNMMSFKMLLNDLISLEENPLKYLLTFKCSLDNLEIFFSCIRSRAKTQDNPSPLEFRYILRKLLFRKSVMPRIRSNYVDDRFNTNHIIEFRDNTRSLIESQENSDERDVFSELIKHLENSQCNAYEDNVLYYITGFIVQKILKKNHCEFCHAVLTTENCKSDHDYALNINKYSAFTSFVNRGKLCFASDAAFTVLKYVNSVFKKAVVMGLLSVDNIKGKLVLATLQKFQPQIQEIFVPKHPVTDICLDLHETEIVKYIANTFLQIRLSSHLKNDIQKKLADLRCKPQKLHKIILFSHV